MNEQNFKNHGRTIFMFHFATWGAVVAVLGGSIVNLINSSPENLYSAYLLVVISLILVSLSWYTRRFSLKAQDRAIRAEENLRHFILTGKPLDARLQLGQVIALRFAPDDEFPALCQEAVAKNLSPTDIKKAIKNWKADHHRA